MNQRWLSAGAALALTVALTGCGSSAPAGSAPQEAQEQTNYISMDAAQNAALEAAQVNADDAKISAAVLDEVAGVTCYKVEFTAGDNIYQYSINAENGEVMEASYREQTVTAVISGEGSQSDSTQSTAQSSGSTDGQNSIGTGTGSTAVSGQITEEKAKKIALSHAGVNAADATMTKSGLDYDNGRLVYELEWYAGGAKYDYEISATTGEVISADYEAKNVVGTGNNAAVSEADAKKKALARVSGATEKDIYEWKVDYDDGRAEYEGKIIYGGSEYEFTIDAATGAITEWDAEKLNY